MEITAEVSWFPAKNVLKEIMHFTPIFSELKLFLQTGTVLLFVIIHPLYSTEMTWIVNCTPETAPVAVHIPKMATFENAITTFLSSQGADSCTRCSEKTVG